MTAAANASGASLLDAAQARGADCAAGFEEHIVDWAIEEGVPAFWRYTMWEGYTVDAAGIQVAFDLRDEHNQDDGGWASYSSLGNVSLIPAKWGRDALREVHAVKSRMAVLLGVAALVALSIGVMMASEQSAHREKVLQLAAGFVGGDPPRVEEFEVQPAPDEEHVYIAEGPIETEAETGRSERLRVLVDLEQRYVIRADWPDRMSCTPPTGDVDEDALRAVALAFARDHCPYWTEEFTFDRHIALPANKGTFHGFTWALPREAGSGACWVTVGLCAIDQRVFRYDCSYVPPEQMTTASVTRAEAMRTARELLTDRHGAAAQIDDVTFSHHMKKYDAPVWTIDFHVSQEGMETWYDAVFIDARNGAVLYPPAQ